MSQPVISFDPRNLSDILDKLQDGIWVSDRDDRIIYANQTLATIAGIPLSEIIGKSLISDFEPETTHDLNRSYLEVKSNLQKKYYEAMVTTPAGKETIQRGWLIPLLSEGEFNGMICTIDDVTYEKQLEKLSDAYFQIAGTVLVVIDNYGTVIKINQKGCEILECEKGEIIGKNWFSEFIPEEDRTNTFAVFQNIIKGEVEPYKHFENKVITKKQTKKLISWYNTCLKDAKNNIIATISSGQDITWQRETDQQIKESEQNLRIIANSITDVVWRTDPDFVFTYVSPSVKRIFGYEPEEVIGKKIFNLFTPDSFKKMGEILREGVTTQSIQNKYYELNMIHKNGSRIPVEVAPTNIFNEAGKHIGFSGVTRNITQRLAMEQSLRDSEEKNRALSESTMEALLFSEQGRCIECNEAASRMFGFEHDELIGILMSDLVTKESKDKVKSFNLQGSEEAYEVIAQHKNGRKFWAEFQWKSYHYKGRVVSVTAVRDISDRVKVRHQLVEALKKAEESDRLKSAFLANMSHEIRTPMNSIMGFSELIAENEISTAERKRYVEIINANGEHLLDILNDIIDFAKIESNQILIKKVPVDLGKFMTESIDLIRNHRLFKLRTKIRLELDIPENPDRTISTDPVRLRQIIFNLLTNAYKFTEQGRIIVGYSKLDPETYQFYVSDTGCGISNDRKQSIFDRFINEDLPGNAGFRGTGLGLAINKSLVEMMGGTIWVESEMGVGSTFYFTLKTNNHS